MSGWPDEALTAQAGSIGPAVLNLIDSETRWVHRRVERIELLNATQLTRSVSADLSVPGDLAKELALFADDAERNKGEAPRRFVVPLGVLPKGALQDFSITPADAHRLTANQTLPLVLAPMASMVRASGAPAKELLGLARRIIHSENPEPDALAQAQALLDQARGDADARARLRGLLVTLNDGYVLLVAIKADVGLPLRVTYTHRQVVTAWSGEVTDPPLIIQPRLPYASGAGPPYRVEIVAPEGLEIETASIAAIDAGAWHPRVSIDTDPGAGAFVQLRAPDAGRPDHAGLQVVFGWPAGGPHHVALIAGLVSTAALAAATLVSYWLDEKMKGSSAGTLLAAPALVTSLALGLATTRVTSKGVNRLRLAALVVALLGVTGALAVSLLGENAARINVLHGVLIACSVLSLLVTFAFAGQATMRPRASVRTTAGA